MTDWQSIFLALGKSVAALAVGLLIHFVLYRALGAFLRRTRWSTAQQLLVAARRPSQVIFPLLALHLLLPMVAAFGDETLGVIRHGISIGLIASFTWLAVNLIDAGAHLVMGKYDVSRADNLEARRVLTQTLVLERTAILFAVAVGIAAALMTFPSIRQIGASLLVSAGVAGLAIGLSARPVLENVIAGLQLALTQPIRVDDVVIVEGEWGRIEEITSTYVVVKIWDERRLVVPLAYFISKPFQNWTRTSADLIGTVFIYADYRLPVAEVRAALERICAATDLWDRRVCNLQVTDATEKSMQIRALVSASDSGRAWDLRVHVREQLIAFLQREYPECLPQVRLEMAIPANDAQ